MKIDIKKFNNETLDIALELCSSIKENGYEAYLVGGCVRDIVRFELGQTDIPNFHDFDIATNMPIEELQKTYKTESNNGEAHGTILVFRYDIPFEVTQFRIDGNYSDGRHPDTVQFTTSIEEDLKRRDFTINAMAMDGEGNVIDTAGGIDDIRNKIIRTVGNPMDRFSEDKLRILRAIRFSLNLGYQIERKTAECMNCFGYHLRKLPVERIRKEVQSLKKEGFNAYRFFNKYFSLTFDGNLVQTNRNRIQFQDLLFKLPGASMEQISALLVYTHDGDPDVIKATREEMKLAKYYYHKVRDLSVYHGHFDWIDMMEIAHGDWKTLIAILPEDAELMNTLVAMLPTAVAMIGKEPDTSKFSALLIEHGCPKGSEFGKRMRLMTDQYYIDLARKMAV